MAFTWEVPVGTTLEIAGVEVVKITESGKRIVKLLVDPPPGFTCQYDAKTLKISLTPSPPLA